MSERRLACCMPHVYQVEVCKEQIEWARSEKRTFLRQARISLDCSRPVVQTRLF